MLQFLNITIRNFLSVGNVTQSVRLNQNGMTLVLGNNIDVSSTSSANSRNGCGKTSILQAISYVLFGEPITNVKLDNLINFINQKGMMVTIEFEVDGVAYRIERGRKPNIFKFYKNNTVLDENEALGENKHTQELIEHLIGMNHSLFCHIVAMSTYTTPFLRSKPAEQREIIEQLLGVTTLSERDEVLVEKLKETKRLIKEEEAVIKAVSDSNARIETAILKAKNESHSWSVVHASNISRLEKEINNLSSIDFDYELSLFDALEEFKERLREATTLYETEKRDTDVLRQELKRIISEKTSFLNNKNKDTQIVRLKTEIQRCETEINKSCESEVKRLTSQKDRTIIDANRKKTEYETKMVSLEEILLELSNPDGHTCTTCGQSIDGTDHLEKIKSNLEKKAANLEKTIEKDIENYNELIESSDSIDKEILKIQQNHEENINTWKEKLDSIKQELEEKENDFISGLQTLEDSIIEMQEAVSMKEEQDIEIKAAVDELKSEMPKTNYPSRDDVWKVRQLYENILNDLDKEKTKENPHESTITSLESTIQELSYVVLNELQDDLKHQEFIHKLLTNKDSFVRKKIIDRNLFLLNSKLAKYLDSLGLPHEVKFKTDLSTEISLQGRDLDFEQLSRGEMNRVILAVSWSFRDVWEELNRVINLLLVDEICDTGLDQAGVENALHILKKMGYNRNVFLISHNENLIGQADHILTVYKEDQFTRYVSDD